MAWTQLDARIALLLAPLLLQACGAPPSLEEFEATPEGKGARELVDWVRRGNTTELASRLAPGLNKEQTIHAIAELSQKLPSEEPRTVELLSYRSLMVNGRWSAKVSFEYQFREQWLLATVGFERGDEKLLLRRAHFQPLTAPLREINKFRLDSRSLRHYLFLCFAVLNPLFIVGTAVLALLTPIPRRKWLWIVAVLVGVFKVSLNWTTGAIALSPLSFQLLGASALRAGKYAPWVLSLSLPVGAVIFLIRRPLLARRQGTQEEGDPAAEP